MNTDPQSESRSPSRRGCRRVFFAVCSLILLLCGYRVYTFLSAGPLEIGPETTVIDGPLLPDGRVDYVGALNERMSEGVTPENNAAVPLVQAFGPEIIPPERRREYFELLGMPEPPPEPNYVIDWTAWIHRDLPPNARLDQQGERALNEQFYKAIEQPWSLDDLPEVAGWLTVNEDQFDLIVAASARPRFYSPLLHGEDPPLVHSWPEPLRNEVWTAAELLLARAMLQLGNGNLEAAWQDVLACHRLSRLIGHGETSSSYRAAIAICGKSCRASESLLHHEQLTANQARRILADLDALPPMPNYVKIVDGTKRFTELDAIQAMAFGDASAVSDRFQPIAGRGLDWGLMMQITNQRYDQEVEAYRLDTYRARRERLKLLWEDLPDAEVGRVSTSVIVAAALFWDRQHVSRKFADVLHVHLARTDDVGEIQADAMLDLLRIALMLAAYHSDHGGYPDALDELAPAYLTEIPLDPFLDEPFHYERTATGYRLYSVGDNMIDDGGRTYSSEPYGDDILVETPATDQAAE